MARGERPIKPGDSWFWEAYEGMSAVKNDKVFLIASETSCSPTPANFVSALEDVYRFVSK